MSSFGGAGGAGATGGSFGQIMSGIGAAANNFNANNRPVTTGSQTADLEALLEKYLPKKSEIDPSKVSAQGTRVDYNF